MWVCKQCQTKNSDSSSSCVICGYDNTNLSSSSHGHNFEVGPTSKPSKLREMITNKLLIIVALIVIVINICFSYSMAVGAMYDGRYAESKTYFDRLLISKIAFPDAYSYVEDKLSAS